MKKVGLMTWFSYDNFGSLLQCRATMKTVEKFGYEVELVNYIPKNSYVEEKSFFYILNKYLKKIIKKIIKKIFTKSQNNNLKTENMYKYREKLKKSRFVKTKSELYLLNNLYDAFICGSDQIWAPTCYDENYFLSFVEEDYKKIAYAPSIGLPIIENKFIRKNMKKLISKFVHLSIREEQGAKMIKELIGKEAKVVLDPTLLLNREEWKEDFIEIEYKDYILTYFLGDNEKYYIESKEIAKKINKKLLIIPTKPRDLLKEECLKEDLGPKEFISLIDNADLILTDSFHGTIFSINFHKPLIVFKRFVDNNLSQNSRIYNILEKLDLKELIFEDNSNEIINFNKNIDYLLIDKKLSELKEDSLNYLKSSLEKATNYKNKSDILKITNNCTGCGVCIDVCPQKCISLEKNQYGFYEYRIDSLKCINCKLCVSVCGQANIMESRLVKDNILYSAFARDKNLLIGSTSGGICTAIAYKALDNKEKVIGCQYDYGKNEAILNIATTKEEFEKMRGSKYLQANPNGIYKDLKYIKSGIIIGTPCQIASIDLFLKKLKKRDNFLLIDFICHGVPSYKLWHKYIYRYKNIKKVLFRDKKHSWKKKYIYILIDNNQEYTFEEKKDLFYHFFTLGNVYNDCCYECKYRDCSVADIRVGDYWGPKFKDESRGVSMLIPFTDKGKLKVRELKDDGVIEFSEENINDYFKYQQSLNFRKPLEYYEIIEDLKSDNISLEDIDKKYNSKLLVRNKLRKYLYLLKNILWKR